MSKRFGRNQRRRAREALAAAEQQIADLRLTIKMDRELLRSQSIQIAAANEFTREVAEIVGREAIIAGKPVRLDYEWDRKRNGDRINIAPHRPFTHLLSVESAPIEMVRYETLYLLDVEEIADVLRNQMHAHVTLADKTVGYAISESALRRMTEHELRRRLAPEIAHGLVRSIKR
jgi:hypothetical protein